MRSSSRWATERASSAGTLGGAGVWLVEVLDEAVAEAEVDALDDIVMLYSYC